MVKSNDDNIKDSIIKNKPNISTSSIKTYMSCIRGVSKLINIQLNTLDDIIENYEKILDAMKDSNYNDRKTKLSALIVSLDSDENKDNDKIKNIISKFREQVKKDKNSNETREDEQKLTEQQMKNFIPWDEIMKIYEEIKIEAEPLFKIKQLNISQFRTLMKYVILSVYVLIPPRRALDFINFKIRGEIDKEKDNYYNKKSKKPSEFIFNSYKLAKKLGTQTVEIPSSLKNIIDKWIGKNPYEYLFVDSTGKKLSQNKITEILNQIFKKNVGVSLLRHAWITQKYGSIDLKSLKDDVYKLGQSDPERLLKYVSKTHA